MAERNTEAKPIWVDYICDECGTGSMIPNGISLMSSPPLFPHVCNNPACNAMRTFRQKYPTIKYDTRAVALEKTQEETPAEVCCGQYANCLRACTPRGAWNEKQKVPSGISLASLGAKHFGNPIPQAWYAAAKELIAEMRAGEI